MARHEARGVTITNIDHLWRALEFKEVYDQSSRSSASRSINAIFGDDLSEYRRTDTDDGRGHAGDSDYRRFDCQCPPRPGGGRGGGEGSGKGGGKGGKGKGSGKGPRGAVGKGGKGFASYGSALWHLVGYAMDNLNPRPYQPQRLLVGLPCMRCGSLPWILPKKLPPGLDLKEARSPMAHGAITGTYIKGSAPPQIASLVSYMFTFLHIFFV